MSVSWKKVWRDLVVNKTRTLLVVLSIAVGVFAFGSTMAGRQTIQRELSEGYLAGHPASAKISTTPFDQNLVEAVARLPAVNQAEGLYSTNVRLQIGPGRWVAATLFARNDYADLRLNAFKPEKGEWPPSKHNMLVERSALFLTEANLGDQILLEMPNGQQRKLTISGLTHDLNQPPAQIIRSVAVYVSMDTLPWLGVSESYNQLLFSVAQNPGDINHITRVATQVENKIERSGRPINFTEIPTPLQHPAAEIIPTILIIFTSLGILSLVLSSFLVINTISAILAQHQSQIGVMKAIGGSRWQIMGLYLRLVGAFGGLALVIGVALGAGGSYLVSLFIADQLNLNIEHFYIPAEVLALEVVAAVLVPILAALWPIWRSTQLTVREAISNYGLGQGQYGRSKFGQRLIVWQNRLPISRPMRISLRNTFRRKGRVIRTLLALILGGGMFISVLTVRGSLFETLNRTLDNQGFDIQLQFTQAHRLTELERELAPIAGVSHIESWGIRIAQPQGPDGTAGDAVQLFAPPPESTLFKPMLLAGRWLTPEDEAAVVVHKNLLTEEPGLSLNQPLTVDINGESYTWEIVGITEDLKPPLEPTSIYINQHYFQRELGHIGRTDGLRLLTNRPDELVSPAVETHLAELGFEIHTIRTASGDQTMITERFNILTGVLTLLSMILAVVGGLGLAGTMSINVLERSREIGVMRAIGASSGHILAIVLVEGVLIGLISWVGAVVVSQPMSLLINHQIGQNLLNTPLDYQFSVLGMVLWLSIVIVVSLGASYFPALQATRLSVRETLAYE